MRPPTTILLGLLVVLAASLRGAHGAPGDIPSVYALLDRVLPANVSSLFQLKLTADLYVRLFECDPRSCSAQPSYAPARSLPACAAPAQPFPGHTVEMIAIIHGWEGFEAPSVASAVAVRPFARGVPFRTLLAVGNLGQPATLPALGSPLPPP